MQFVPNLLTSQEIIATISIQKAYSFISNMENFGLWFPEVIEIVSDNKLDHGVVGKTYLEKVNLPPNGIQQLGIEVKKAEAPNLYVTESEFSPLFPRMTMQLTELEPGITRINWSMISRSKDYDFIEKELPGFKQIIGSRASLALQQLKKILEQQ